MNSLLPRFAPKRGFTLQKMTKRCFPCIPMVPSSSVLPNTAEILPHLFTGPWTSPLHPCSWGQSHYEKSIISSPFWFSSLNHLPAISEQLAGQHQDLPSQQPPPHLHLLLHSPSNTAPTFSKLFHEEQLNEEGFLHNPNAPGPINAGVEQKEEEEGNSTLRNGGSYSGCPLHLQELTAFAKKPKEKVTEPQRRHCPPAASWQPSGIYQPWIHRFPIFLNSSNSKLIHSTSLYNVICDLTPKAQQIRFFP